MLCVTSSLMNLNRAARGLAWAALLGLGYGPLQAGEQILFSGRRGALELPAWREKLQEPSLVPNKLSGGSGALDALMIPTGAQPATGIPDRRQLDLLERRKNWMFQTGDISKPAAPDALEGRAEDANRIDGKAKNSIDRFLEGHDQKKQSENDRMTKDLPGKKDFVPGTRQPSGVDLTRQAGTENTTENIGDSTSKSGLEAGLPGTDREAIRGLAGEAGFRGMNPLNRLTTERQEQRRDRERETQLVDFGRLINPGAASAGARGAEAFGLGGDPARGAEALGARGSQDFGRRNDFLNGGVALPGMMGPRFSGRDEFNPKAGGGSAFFPEAPKPVEGLRIQPRPTILEIPRRKI